jgi:hypothetical protein
MATAAVSNAALCHDAVMLIQQNPALHLHVTSVTREGLDKALAKLDEYLNLELPNLVDERRLRGRRNDSEHPGPHERVNCLAHGIARTAR